MVVYKITASLSGRGVLDYEVCMGIDNDSNHPTIGSSVNSYTTNGKLCKQPATNLWTTRASQGKKTLTNPYDRSLIALS